MSQCLVRSITIVSRTETQTRGIWIRIKDSTSVRCHPHQAPPCLSWFLLCSRGKTFEQILKVENFENVETRLIVWTNISFDAEKRKQSCLKIGREIKSDNRRNRFLNRSEIFFPKIVTKGKWAAWSRSSPGHRNRKKLKYFSISLLIMNRRRLTCNYLFAEFIYPLSSLKPNKSEDDEEEKKCLCSNQTNVGEAVFLSIQLTLGKGLSG